MHKLLLQLFRIRVCLIGEASELWALVGWRNFLWRLLAVSITFRRSLKCKVLGLIDLRSPLWLIHKERMVVIIRVGHWWLRVEKVVLSSYNFVSQICLIIAPSAWLESIQSNFSSVLNLGSFTSFSFDFFNLLLGQFLLFSLHSSLHLFFLTLLFELLSLFASLCLFHLLFEFFLVTKACLLLYRINFIPLRDICSNANGVGLAWRRSTRQNVAWLLMNLSTSSRPVPWLISTHLPRARRLLIWVKA